jgi:hypothetical protein
LEDRPLYEIPEDSVGFTFQVVTIENVPVEDAFITVKQSEFPFSFVFDNTSSEGTATFLLGLESTFDYTINKGTYTENFGSFSTNTSNETRQFILLLTGCSQPVNITPLDWDIQVNFSQEHLQRFEHRLENTNYLESFEWKLDDKSFASNYPFIDITFTEPGDKRVSVTAVQSDCILSWGWNVHLSDVVVPDTIQNYTTETQYTKESFLNEILLYTPGMFVVVIVISAGVLVRRIGKRPSKS